MAQIRRPASPARRQSFGDLERGQTVGWDSSCVHRRFLVAGFSWAVINWCSIDLTLFELPICKRVAIHFIGKVVSFRERVRTKYLHSLRHSNPFDLASREGVLRASLRPSVTDLQSTPVSSWFHASNETRSGPSHDDLWGGLALPSQSSPRAAVLLERFARPWPLRILVSPRHCAWG